jgi:hypothetical protein
MDRQVVLDGQAQVLGDDERRDERVAPAERERRRITGCDEADQHGRGAALGGPIDLEADVAGSPVDQGDLAVRIVEVGVRAGLAIDAPGRAAPADVGDVPGEAAAERSEVERGRVPVRTRDRGRQIDDERNASALGTLVSATDRAVLAPAGEPAMRACRRRCRRTRPS